MDTADEHQSSNTYINSIIVSAPESEEFKHVVQAFHLDSPQSGSFIKVSSPLKVTGWIVLRSHDPSAELVINRHSTPIIVPVDVERPDVVTRILLASPETMPERVKCGFSVSFLAEESNTLELFLNGLYYPLRQIRCIADDVPIERAVLAWDEYNSNKLEQVDKSSICILKNLDKELVENCVWGSPRVFSAKAYCRGLDKNSAEYHWANRFYDLLVAEDFPLHLLRSAVEQGSLQVPEPFSAGVALCRESFHVQGNITALRFICGDGECFYVLQHVSSADAVYFPKRKILLLIKHMPVDSVKRFVIDFCADAVNNFNYSADENPKNFLGIITSHGRPYHLYYDVAPVVYEAHLAGLLRNVPRMIHYHGADFCSFKKILEVDCQEFVRAPLQLGNEVKEQLGFYFHLGCHYYESRQMVAKSFDRLMLSNVRRSYNFSDAEYISAQSCYPLVWFGLTVEKRSWIEQVTGISSIINDLHGLFPNLGVVFDGWTSPLTPTSGDQQQIQADTNVADKIKKLVPPSVRTFSVIGSSSDEKIVFARLIDACVVNSGTGAIHVSRFAGRPGVGHLNSRMIDMPDHIRPKIRLVDKSHIQDELGSENMRMDFVSYSIDWKVIYKMLEEILLY